MRESSFSKLKFFKPEYVKKFFYVVPKFPREASIEVTSRCNLDCKICKRKELGIKDQDISLTNFKKIINRIPPQVNQISFSGYGEPLITKDIYDMIIYAKKKGKTVFVTSNGYVFLSQKNRKSVLDSGVNVLRISIEDIKGTDEFGHKYNQKMLDSLSLLVKERNEKRYATKLYFNTIVHKNNVNQIEEIIHFAKKIGFDQVELIHLDKKSNEVYEYLSRDEEVGLYKSLENKKFGIKVTSLYDQYKGIRRFAFRNRMYCPMTFDVIYVNFNGDVTPCCFGLPRYVLGNIFKNSIKDIWNGDKFKQFRKNQQKICAGCTLYRFD